MVGCGEVLCFSNKALAEEGPKWAAMIAATVFRRRAESLMVSEYTLPEKELPGFWEGSEYMFIVMTWAVLGKI